MTKTIQTDVRPIIANATSFKCGTEKLNELEPLIAGTKRKQAELLSESFKDTLELTYEVCKEDIFMSTKVLSDSIPMIDLGKYLPETEWKMLFEDDKDFMGKNHKSRWEYLARTLTMALFKGDKATCYLIPNEEIPKETMKVLAALAQTVGLHAGFGYEQRKADGPWCGCVRFFK